MKPLYESVKEDKSEADKLFEELGYKKKYQIYKDKVLIIGYTMQDEEAEECPIMFLRTTKKITTNIWVDMQELKAINQKCKELGWLDE